MLCSKNAASWYCSLCQVSNSAEQQPALRIHHALQSWLGGFCTALPPYHRHALKHCLPVIQKHNQYFKGLKDWHRTFSLSFPCHSCPHFKENYAGLQVHDFFTSSKQGIRKLGNNVKSNSSIHQRKSCQDTSVILIYRELIMPLTWGWISVIFSGCQSFCLLLWWLEEWMAFCNAKRSWPSVLGICKKYSILVS